MKRYFTNERLRFAFYIIGLTYLLFAIEREQSLELIGIFGLLTLIYLQQITTKISVRNVAIMAITLRCISWLSFPALSDDIFRFIWDGSLILDGVNPYLHTPSAFLTSNFREPYESLFPLLNSPGYYSVYPTVIQFFSAFGALAANDPYLASLLIKLPILLAEIGTIWLLPQVLQKLGVSPRMYKIYALNPLVIIELCGNAHFEGVMIFFVVLCLHWLLTEQPEFAGIALALAVATKLIPLILFPFLLKAIPGRDKWWFALSFLFCSLLLFIPVLQPAFLEHFFDSIDLYFRNFEFNASVYYLMRAAGYLITGYNMISVVGPALLLISALTMFWLWIQQKPGIQHALTQAGIGLMIYYLFATTVHPWYLSMLLLLAAFNQRPVFIGWSLVAFLSYLAYSEDGVSESMWILLVEYSLVLLLLLFGNQIKQRLASILG